MSFQNVNTITINGKSYPPAIFSSLVLNDIPVGTGSTNPPLKDSGVQIDSSQNITGANSYNTAGGVSIEPNPPSTHTSGNTIDLSNGTLNDLIATDTTNRILVIGAGLTGTNDRDLVITNNSASARRNLNINCVNGNVLVRAGNGNTISATNIIQIISNNCGSIVMDTGGIRITPASGTYVYIDGVAFDDSQNITGVGSIDTHQINLTNGASKIENTVADSGANYPLVWPNEQGAANSYLKNDGSGNLSWYVFP